MSSGIKEVVIFWWRRKKNVSARGFFSIYVCQWYIDFALYLNSVKLLVRGLGFFSSENENRPHIVIHVTFIGMGGSLSSNKNQIIQTGIT